MSIIIEDLGIPLTHQKITPGDTITSLSSNCYFYQRWKLNYDAGTDEIVANDWIVGADSGAVARVISIYDDGTGTWAADTVKGYLILDSMVGTWTDDEKLKVAADATMADVNGSAALLMEDYDFKGMQAKAALISVITNTALVGLAGSKPNQTALIGHSMIANSSIVLRNIEAVRRFKCVDYASGSASVLNATYFF